MWKLGGRAAALTGVQHSSARGMEETDVGARSGAPAAAPLRACVHASKCTAVWAQSGPTLGSIWARMGRSVPSVRRKLVGGEGAAGPDE